MKILIVLLLPLFVGAAVPVVDGVKLAKKDKIKDVQIYAAEKDGDRVYYASYETTIEGDFDKAVHFVVNFPSRCNNSYRKERKFLAKDVECVYHNENMIESQIERKLKVLYEDQGNVIDRFVLKRRIWNKGLHTYNDLVMVKELPKQGKQEKVIEVSYRLLNDEEAAELIDNPLPFDNAFYYTIGTYRLIKLPENKIQIQYSYQTKTNHWFLTSSMIQGSVHSSLASGARYAVDGISGAINRGSSK